MSLEEFFVYISKKTAFKTIMSTKLVLSLQIDVLDRRLSRFGKEFSILSVKYYLVDADVVFRVLLSS